MGLMLRVQRRPVKCIAFLCFFLWNRCTLPFFEWAFLVYIYSLVGNTDFSLGLERGSTRKSWARPSLIAALVPNWMLVRDKVGIPYAEITLGGQRYIAQAILWRLDPRPKVSKSGSAETPTRVENANRVSQKTRNFYCPQPLAMGWIYSLPCFELQNLTRMHVSAEEISYLYPW